MATIRVKRGTSKPTTANLSYVGELAFDYSKNALYARNSTEVVKVGGELEKVYSFEGIASTVSVPHDFDPAYIYKVHVISITQSSSPDLSATTILYRTAGLSNLLGSYLTVYSNDVAAGVTKNSARNITTFTIQDVHSSGASLTSGTAKVIDFEISPIFATTLSDIRQWIVYGKVVTTVTGQADATITLADFAHSIFGSLGNLYINPGLNLGTPDLISVTVYRSLRK